MLSLCEEFDETYDHLWLCEEQEDCMQQLILSIKEKLILLINEQLHESMPKITTVDNIIDPSIWELEYSDNSLTFIDLIKGIIPSNFDNINNNFIKNQKKYYTIIEKLRSHLLQLIDTIWIYRCNAQIEKETNNGITRRDKKIKDYTDPYIDVYRKINNDNLFNLESLEANIVYGTNIFKYYDITSRES